MVYFYAPYFSIVSKQTIALPFQARDSRIVYYWSISYKMVPNIVKDSRATPLLAIDEVEQVQRQRIVSLIGHMFKLTYTTMVNELIQDKKLNRCYGFAIQHPNQRQHSRLIMDKDDSWLYYRGRCGGKIDLNAVLNNVESVLNALFKLSQSWEKYVSELPKMPWTTIFLTSLELDGFDGDLQSRILHAIHDGPNALKNCSIQQAEMECPEQVVTKDEEAMEIDSVINVCKSNKVSS